MPSFVGATPMVMRISAPPNSSSLSWPRRAPPPAAPIAICFCGSTATGTARFRRMSFARWLQRLRLPILARKCRGLIATAISVSRWSNIGPRRRRASTSSIPIWTASSPPQRCRRHEHRPKAARAPRDPRHRAARWTHARQAPKQGLSPGSLLLKAMCRPRFSKWLRGAGQLCPTRRT